MNCLVLSAGGMYGAYQAGAWKELSDVFHPDLVVGASIGAVNGWAIAGGCPPDELIQRWLNLEGAERYRWKLPKTIFGGILDSQPLARGIREIYESFQPKVDFAMVVTDLLKLRPRVFHAGQVTSEHLIASTAIVGLFDQVRLDGRLYSDGGLLSAVPLWAAAELGATQGSGSGCAPGAPRDGGQGIRRRHADAFSISRPCSGWIGSHPHRASGVAWRAARSHPLEPRERRKLDPGRPPGRRPDETFHCELF